MTEESSGSFSSFWQRSVDKVSSKTVKFMPNVTKPGNGNWDFSFVAIHAEALIYIFFVALPPIDCHASKQVCLVASIFKLG
jgi:hypothetical protein